MHCSLNIQPCIIIHVLVPDTCFSSIIHVLVPDTCRGFESHLRQLFSRKSDCLGCAVLLCLVCLFDLACFFLSFFLHLKTYIIMRSHVITCPFMAICYPILNPSPNLYKVNSVYNNNVASCTLT